ncbi:hypothetical protein GCM10011507_19400 [Edaphobacter acidisoli]|uniref:LssY-like C-terminal domain-containing protein n=2 Tax=Edaphobacter acidisoli TaxID=2040573 RepID=A0A916W5I8_9BACT|nr:hypothetical protein GCM10011507_19400 [Edaphobacter acidisoli]
MVPGVLTLAAAGQSASTTSSSPATPPVALPGVQAIVSMRTIASANTAKADAATTHKGSYEFTVTGSDWLDTGVVLEAGEKASFTTTGTMNLTNGQSLGPDGEARGWKDLLRQFPLNSANAGALIGRVSDVNASVPFLIGAKSEVTVPTRGRLYLRANLSDDLTATGNYKVKVTFAAEPKAAAQTTTAATNVSRLVSPSTFANIPRRVSDMDGHEGDMVNYALVGTEDQVKAAFQTAGWTSVDKSVGDALLHGLMATMSHEAYTEMPMSTLYLFGRPQDLSFARADPLMVAAERHHLRAWKTDQMIDGKPLWVGSATHDIGFEKDQRNGGVTHKIDPEIDKERDFLLQSFDAAGVFSSAAYVTPDNPLQTAKTATGGRFNSDGRIVIMELK